MSQPEPLTEQQLDEYAVLAITADHTGERIDPAVVTVLVDEVRKLQHQRRFLLSRLARKDAASGEGDRALREFLGAEVSAGSAAPAPPVVPLAASQPADGPGRVADEEQQAETKTPVHVGGNAEDCPACEGTNLPYPFICPGPDAAAARPNKATVPCSAVAFRVSHNPHSWEPQPDMDLVRCSGYAPPAVVAEPGKENGRG